ncbi:FAD-dependent oxidoreductase [Chloroflexota bacterium]
MKLFEPGKIGSLAIKNRILMCPMAIGGLEEPDGRLSQRGIDYYVARAKGGVGLIITGFTRVSRELEPNIEAKLVVDSKLSIPWLSDLAEAVHDYGAKVAVQLSAGLGRVTFPTTLMIAGAVAPSALPAYWDPSVITRELRTDEIERLVHAFEVSAGILRIAGIDAVELHAHEGYLFDQFMTTLWNKRRDKYGGDLDNRLRFPLEVIEAIKRGAGADFPIIFRFGLKHYIDGGRDIEEGLEIARRIEVAGADSLEVDAGCYETWYWAHPPTTLAPGCMVDMAQMTKEVVKIPVIAIGKLGYPELAETVLQEGKADFICLGRALLADPEWPTKVKQGRLEEIRPCIGCHDGCLKRELDGKSISCAVNPATGMEREFNIKPAGIAKSVLVVGGGPSGMEAARTAALRGHKVTLWEKSSALGGNLIPASIPNFKQDYKSLINFLTTQINKLGVAIELGKEATPELVQKVNPDVVFVATGSMPIIPDIPGIEKKMVVTAIDLLSGKRDAGELVVVVGGGLVGCETALYLAQKGKKLTIVEMLESVMLDVYVANRMHLLELLADAGVVILTETSLSGITSRGVNIVNKYGERSDLKADTVVLAVGLKSDGWLLEALKDKVPEVYAIGDCIEPRKVMQAIWEGFRTARLV